VSASARRREDIERLFHAEAERYDAAYEADSRAGRLLRARLAAVVARLGTGNGSAVLDVGMGGGRLCAELANRGWTVSGVDATEKMVELARKRVAPAFERLVRGHAEALPFPDSSFDALVSTGTLEYADDLEVVLGELSRVLRPGGVAVVSFPRYDTLPAVFRRLVLDSALRALKRGFPFGRAVPVAPLHPIGRRELERTLAAAGLVAESVETVGPRLMRQLVVTARKSRRA
jgi:ubiquinone/menaquinone biosynthesis C-methylase UbiE